MKSKIILAFFDNLSVDVLINFVLIKKKECRFTCKSPLKGCGYSSFLLHWIFYWTNMWLSELIVSKNMWSSFIKFILKVTIAVVMRSNQGLYSCLWPIGVSYFGSELTVWKWKTHKTRQRIFENRLVENLPPNCLTFLIYISKLATI